MGELSTSCPSNSAYRYRSIVLRNHSGTSVTFALRSTEEYRAGSAFQNRTVKILAAFDGCHGVNDGREHRGNVG